MKLPTFISISCIVLLCACVDRLSFDIGSLTDLPVVVDGFISTQPGPYQVRISKAFDPEGIDSHLTPVSAKKVTVHSSMGEMEELVEMKTGVYETRTLQGKVGGIYKIKLEFLDGTVYESVYDTINANGSIEKMYYEFNENRVTSFRDHYGFDIFVDADAGDRENFQLLWRFTATYKAVTHPEYDASKCVYLDGKCNWRPLCSGLINVGGYLISNAIFERVKPCECCTCWYNLVNDSPIIQDSRLFRKGKFQALKIGRVPLNSWVFSDKVHVQVEQLSISKRTFQFWSAIRAQEEATNSLFQPVSGRIPSNFIQLSGPARPISGIFYAASSDRKSLFLYKSDVPSESLIPPLELMSVVACQDLFPHSTNVQPSFWID